MRVYAVTLTPLSPFGTPLKGDTLFGQFCWQCALNKTLISRGLEYWIERYQEQPFAVFSSAWPHLTGPDGTDRYCLPRPALPISPPADMPRTERLVKKKQTKGERWLFVDASDLRIDFMCCQTKNDTQLFKCLCETLPEELRWEFDTLPETVKKPVVMAEQAHNSINRLTATTGQGFDPFTLETLHFAPGIRLVVFVGVHEAALTVDQLTKGLTEIGKAGFGRDASSGLGRFAVAEPIEINWPACASSQDCYTLAPCIPPEAGFSEIFAKPFTRFGKHGSLLALSNNPFKNPVVMADEGAVFVPETGMPPQQPYIGRAATNLSRVEPHTVAQGYSLYLPLTGRTI
jgi:CRISPR-associated protein Csm4